jgi:hypothetical protein
MADEIKFIRIPASELPKLRYRQDATSAKDLAYYLKFRIVSEDKSKASKWSQNFEVPAGPNRIGKVTFPTTSVSLTGTKIQDNTAISLSGTWNPNDAIVFKYVSKKALTNNVATLTTAGLSDDGTPVAHDFSVGDQITVSGIDSIFNGTYTVSAKTATTVSYAKTAPDVVATDITGSKIVQRSAKLHTKTFDVYVRSWAQGATSADWYYVKTVSVNNFQHIVPATIDGANVVSVDVAVLIPTYTTLDEGSIIDPTTSFPTSILFQGSIVI